MTNYLEASQELQLDKQTYGSNYIHLYVDNIEENWLANWTWGDAFVYNASKGNFKIAFRLITEWLKQL